MCRSRHIPSSQPNPNPSPNPNPNANPNPKQAHKLLASLLPGRRFGNILDPNPSPLPP